MATKLSEMAGSRPKVYNLKDNDLLKDKTIDILKITVHQEGEFGLFFVMNCKIVDAVGIPGEEIIVTTGATDIVDRLLPLVEKINAGMTIQATLTKVGRKWLID